MSATTDRIMTLLESAYWDESRLNWFTVTEVESALKEKDQQIKELQSRIDTLQQLLKEAQRG